MRQTFIQTDKRDEAKNQAPWACKIVKVEGGYKAFESWTDYETWRNQI